MARFFDQIGSRQALEQEIADELAMHGLEPDELEPEQLAELQELLADELEGVPAGRRTRLREALVEEWLAEHHDA